MSKAHAEHIIARPCKVHLCSLVLAKTDNMLLHLQVIVFSFSKKECEALALQMAPLDLNDDSEHKLVEGVFWNAVDSLSEDDRRLPQVALGSGRLPQAPERRQAPSCAQDRNIRVLLYHTSPREASSMEAAQFS